MSNLHSRVRKCDNCNKQLGSTVTYCYDCQSDESVDTSDMTTTDNSMLDQWGAAWKLHLGVDPDLVIEQHGSGVL